MGRSLVQAMGDKEWVGYVLFLCSSMNVKDLVFKKVLFNTNLFSPFLNQSHVTVHQSFG